MHSRVIHEMREFWPIAIGAFQQLEPLASLLGSDGSYALAAAVLLYVLVLVLKDVLLPLVMRRRDGRTSGEREEQWAKMFRWAGEMHRIVDAEDGNGRKRVWGLDPHYVVTLENAVRENTEEVRRLREEWQHRR